MLCVIDTMFLLIDYNILSIDLATPLSQFVEFLLFPNSHHYYSPCLELEWKSKILNKEGQWIVDKWLEVMQQVMRQ